MLAGGMVVAAPSMVPTAAAAGQLYVSAENAQFDNLFAGAMIVEIIVKDPSRSATNESAAQPTVMVDNQRLLLAQGADGNWYGYIGDKTSVAAVDGYADQLDFGTTTVLTNGGSASQLNYTTVYTAIDSNLDASATDNFGVIDNPPSLSNWNSTLGAESAATNAGQINIASGQWPFIQVFDFTQGDFDIVLEQPGTDEVVTLDHNNDDLDDYASLTLDRNSATQGAEVHMFIVDQQLNIDPTDEDVVIFKSKIDGSTTNAGVAWTNGTMNPEALKAVAPIASAYTAMGTGHGFGDNGKLLINYDTTDSGTNVLVKDGTLDDTFVSVTTGYVYLVFVEDADNTGTFSNVADDDDANLNVVTTAKRGTSATFDYNDSAQSFIVANDFGTIDMDESSIGSEWNSGEELTVTLRDQDLNKNTGSDEDLTMALSDLIPSIQIGSPILIDSPATGNSTVDGVVNATKQAFSNVRIVDSTPAATTGDNGATELSINMGIPVSTLTAANANSTKGTV
jgi:hypothetical protein